MLTTCSKKSGVSDRGGRTIEAYSSVAAAMRALEGGKRERRRVFGRCLCARVQAKCVDGCLQPSPASATSGTGGLLDRMKERVLYFLQCLHPTRDFCLTARGEAPAPPSGACAVKACSARAAISARICNKRRICLNYAPLMCARARQPPTHQRLPEQHCSLLCKWPQQSVCVVSTLCLRGCCVD